tara:strand:- start:344 stop:1462 length:1119 start_codon:yes stop_codon:yes gene_type:complete
MSDLVAWYKFDGDFTDSSGNNYDLTEISGGLGATTKGISANLTGSGAGAPMESYAEFTQFGDISSTGDIGSTNYRYLKSTNTTFLDTFKYTNAFTLSFWMKTSEGTAQNVTDDLKTMDIFSVGDYSYDSGPNRGEGFKVQLSCENGVGSRTGGADADVNEWYLSINLGGNSEAYADTRKLRNGQSTPGVDGAWDDEGFTSPTAAGEISDGNWHNIVVSYDPARQLSGTIDQPGHGAGQTVLFYIDGVRINTKGAADSHIDNEGTFTGNWNKKTPYNVRRTGSVTANGADVLTIGDKFPLSSGITQNSGNTSTSPYGGQLTDIRIWDRILTDGIEDPSNLNVAETDESASPATGEVGCLWNSGNSDLNGSHSC